MADQVDYVGQRLGNYHLIRLLGQGGFADVYLGEHIHLKTQAAVKLLHTRLTNDDIENFRREAQTIASLVHPHIVRVLDFGVEGHAPFLVMDFAPNGTLRHRHPKGTRVQLLHVVAYVKQVADALYYAHAQLSFIRIKALFLKKCATLPSAFSGWVFSDNLARRRFLVLSHL